MRRVAVVGNCQATFTAKMYREYFGVPRHEDVRYVDDLHLDSQAAWARIGEVDLVLLQQRDFSSPRVEDAPPGVKVVTFPLVLEAFLWPYAHEAHIHNKPEPPLHDGPYPAQLGDKFLNRLIAEGVDPREGLERYLEHDIARATHIDRLLELHLDQQRDRDERTGFELASILEDGFRDSALFMSPHHPNASLFGRFLEQLFVRLDLPAEEIAAMRDALLASPFPSGELPIHPGVIRHFGLKYADENTLYKFHDEGRFTFAEHVERYMVYAHNHALRVGMRHFHEHRWDDALPCLEEGLQASPASAGGWRAQGLILGSRGDAPASADAFRRAMEADPASPDAYADLSRTLKDLGDREGALELARRAVQVARHHGPSQLILSELLFLREDWRGAADAGMEASRLLPMEAYPAWIAAVACWHAGDVASTRSFCLRSLNLDARMTDARNLLAETYERDGRRQEAIDTLAEQIARGLDNDQTHSQLGMYHRRNAMEAGDRPTRRRELERSLQALEEGYGRAGRDDFPTHIEDVRRRLRECDEEDARAARPDPPEPARRSGLRRLLPLRWLSRT